MRSDPHQAEIWDVRLERLQESTGHEIAKSRPALVISDNGFNSCGLEMVVIVPIGGRKARYSTDVPLLFPEGGVDKDSTIFCDQVRAVAHARLISCRGQVKQKTLARVDEILKRILHVSAL